MTNYELTAIKKFAKEGLASNGIKVFMKEMVLLESSSKELKNIVSMHGFRDNILFQVGGKMFGVHYAMIGDRKSGKEWQIIYDRSNGYVVNEYKA